MNHNTIVLLGLTVLTGLACSEHGDTQPPKIEIIAPANEAEFVPGEAIRLQMVLTDNEQLSGYKVEIHDDFDDHDHKSTSTGTAWIFQKTWQVDPTDRVAIDHQEIVIPERIANEAIARGSYHMGIYCTDLSGNESHTFIEIHIE